MIASPGDVNNERNIIRKVVTEWNVINSEKNQSVLLPIGWETHTTPEMGDRPQEIINKQILRNCDLLVGVFWTRIGTATGKHISGTVEEIEEHIKSGKPTMLYFSSVPVQLESVDQEQWAELVQFKESCKTRGIFETFADIQEFESKFQRQLQIKLNSDEYFQNEVSELVFDGSIENEIPQLSKEAQMLLKEGSLCKVGQIERLKSAKGLEIFSNGKQFVDSGDPKSIATWESSVEELEYENLIKDQGYKRQIFKLTKQGYDLAEQITI